MRFRRNVFFWFSMKRACVESEQKTSKWRDIRCRRSKYSHDNYFDSGERKHCAQIESTICLLIFPFSGHCLYLATQIDVETPRYCSIADAMVFFSYCSTFDETKKSRYRFWCTFPTDLANERQVSTGEMLAQPVITVNQLTWLTDNTIQVIKINHRIDCDYYYCMHGIDERVRYEVQLWSCRCIDFTCAM